MNITENVVLASVMMDGAVVCQINSDATSNVAHLAAFALKESASSVQKAPEYATITAAHLTAFAQNLDAPSAHLTDSATVGVAQLTVSASMVNASNITKAVFLPARTAFSAIMELVSRHRKAVFLPARLASFAIRETVNH